LLTCHIGGLLPQLYASLTIEKIEVRQYIGTLKHTKRAEAATNTFRVISTHALGVEHLILGEDTQQGWFHRVLPPKGTRPIGRKASQK